MAECLLLRNTNIKRILNGHPWIYKTEIDRIEGDYTPGGIVNVLNHKKEFIRKRIHKSKIHDNCQIIDQRY